MLAAVKGWNGPATCVEELNEILNLNPDKMEQIVRTTETRIKLTSYSSQIYSG